MSVADDLVTVTVQFALLTFLLQPLLDKSFPWLGGNPVCRWWEIWQREITNRKLSKLKMSNLAKFPVSCQTTVISKYPLFHKIPHNTDNSIIRPFTVLCFNHLRFSILIFNFHLFLNVIFYGNLFLHFKCWSDAVLCLVFFIGPESDHCLPLSLTHWLTNWLTPV